MSEYKVKVIRAAFKEIQKLTHEYFEDVAKIIKNFVNGDLGDHRKLSGYMDLWRTKRNETRVIWAKIDTNTLLVIKAGKRKDVYKNISEDRSRSNPLELYSLLGIEKERINDIPCYEWSDRKTTSWHQFVYGGYLHSPVLTEEQRKIFARLNNSSQDFSNTSTITSLLLQSSPGTGKTICAALLASELHKIYNWSVTLILPRLLCNEVKEFSSIKEINQQHNIGFFVGTFEEWLKSVNPDIHSQIASLDEERKAMEIEARRTHLIGKDEELPEIHLGLYKSFVYKKDENARSNLEKHPIYRENSQVITRLVKIKDEWKQKLKGKIIWLDALERVTQQLAPQNISTSLTSIFIFDEAQDYLLDELNLVVDMLSRWQKEHNHPSIIWLLGDMNQRIQPVNFDWGDLHLSKRYTLKYNYRNTEKILEFANIFHAISREINAGSRKLPEPSNPSDAFEKGEPVKILEISSINDASSFLIKLSENIRYSLDGSERSLLSRLCSQISIIYAHPERIPNNRRNLKGLNFLDVYQSKGREFDACVAFCVFRGEGKPSFQESNNWYTIFTRPRHRLLIIATSDEIERIGRDKFQKCDFFDTSNSHLEILVSWITEWSNSEHLFKDKDAILNQIYQGINSHPVQIYWDTYAALRLTRIDDVQITKIESNMIKNLSSQGQSILQNEFLQTESILSVIDQIPLRCLILRCLNRSWDAVDEASKIQDLMPQEYNRIVNAIANDLENKGLLYEAARVRVKTGVPFPNEFPFSESFPDNTKSIVSNLCKLGINKINREVKL